MKGIHLALMATLTATSMGQAAVAQTVGQTRTVSQDKGEHISSQGRVRNRYHEYLERTEEWVQTGTRSVTTITTENVWVPDVVILGDAVSANCAYCWFMARTVGDWLRLVLLNQDGHNARLTDYYNHGANQRLPQSVIDGVNLVLAHASSAVLNTRMPDRTSIVVGTDGTLIAALPTAVILNDSSLRLNHSSADHYNGTSERTFGGILDYDGNSYSVLATQLASPIALDLNGDGKIDVTGKATGAERYDPKLGFNPVGAVSFDLHGLGRTGHFEWLQPTGDGFLVDDSKGKVTKAAYGDGVIDGNDLFGGQRYGNGYAKLAAEFGRNAQFASASGNYRLSHGFGNLTGRALKGLKVWIDKNHDGKVQPSELYTLDQLGITEISSEYRLITNNKESRMVSSFVRHGKRCMTEDVWFAEDPKDFNK